MKFILKFRFTVGTIKLFYAYINPFYNKTEIYFWPSFL